MTHTPKVSVLVPTYNAERTLSLCLESILNQSFRDFEVLLMDDGSTDGSPTVAAQFKTRDSRIKIISGPNIGYGATLNKALKRARGQYISIVEPDDFIHKEFLKTLYGLATHYRTDIVKCGFVANYQTTGKTIVEPLFHHNHEHVDTETVFSARDNQNVFFVIPTVWSALYRRNFLQKQQIKFLETPGASFQDIGFQFKAFAKAKTLYCTNLPLYYYTKDNAGSSVKSDQKNAFIVQEFDTIDAFLAKNHLSAYQPIAAICRARSYMWNVNRLHFLSAWSFVSTHRPPKIDLKNFDLNSAAELKFFAKHPRIYVLLRPLFKLKNYIKTRLFRLYQIVRSRRKCYNNDN